MRPSHSHLLLAFIGFTLANTNAVFAGNTTEWHQTAGGNVRIVLESAPGDENGVLPATMRGGIEIQLDDGWHTYWRDPGSSGIPPMLQWSPGSNIRDATIHFPAPQWVQDDYGGYAGYTEPVSLPITFETGGRSTARLQGMLLLGICEVICIPVALPFDMNIKPSTGSSITDIIVRDAFAQLPIKMPGSMLSVGLNDDGFWVSPEASATEWIGTAVDAVFVHLEGAQVSYPKRMTKDDGGTIFNSKINHMTGDETLRQMSITAVAGDKAYEAVIEVDMPAKKN